MATTTTGTIQTNIKAAQDTVGDITKYALFLGGPAATNELLRAFDPLKGGWGRLFMVRKPAFLDETIPDKLKYFKHILEYANTGVSGMGDYTLEFQSMTGGYGGRQIQVPTHTTDGMNNFTVQVYEMSGSPIREVLDFWINGISDKMSTFAHYNGSTLPKILANQTAEFIYVLTDNTGQEVEYACLLADATPTTIPTSVLDYTAGSHDLITYTISFNCIRYDSIQINKVAKALLNKYRVLANSLNFHSGIDIGSDDGQRGLEALTPGRTGYNVKTGYLEKVQSDTNMDNIDQGSPIVD